MPESPIYVNEELFLGRLDEQEQFRQVLQGVLNTRFGGDEPPFIFLIHGEGGMGKSQLTRRLLDIAAQEPPFERDCLALRLDWEIIRDQTPALRGPRDRLSPEEVLAAFHRAVLEARPAWGRYFSAYQAALKQRQEAEQAVAKAMEGHGEGGQYALLRDLGAAGLAKLVRLSLPVGQTGEALSQALLSAGIQLGAEKLAQARQQADQFLQARLKPELYQIYRQPHEQLARSLGEGFKQFSRTQPLVLLLDTYEIIAPAADRWLRFAIQAAGSRTAWVIAGRDNLAPSRPGDRYVGYSAEFPRHLLIWDIQELAIDYVTSYLQDRVPDRPPTPGEAAALHRATLGVPLALQQAADLWAQGAPLEAITEGTPDYAPRETLVKLMCERVLIHVEQDAAGQADRRAIYALAMQPRPNPASLAAVLKPDGAGFFDLPAWLAGLASRYSVVRPAGGGSLHEAMGEFVGEYLLRTAAGSGDLVQEIASQTVAAARAERARLEGELFDLAERVESEDWQQATLDLVHWLFWQDELTAWREVVPRLVEGLGYDPKFARSLLAAAGRFKARLRQEGRKRLERLRPDPDNLEAMLTELERLDRRGGWLAGDDPQVTAERQAIVSLWRGRELANRQRYAEACQAYQAAEGYLPEAATLREQLGQAFYELSGRLLWPEGSRDAIPTELGLETARRSVLLDAAHGDAWYRLGAALSRLNQHDEAIAAYQQAVQLDPNYAYPHNGLGNVYRALSRYDEAIAAYQQAVQLDPKFAYPHNGLGTVYRDLSRYDEAIAVYLKAVQLDPEDASYLASLAAILRQTGQTGEADSYLAKARKRMDKEDDYNKACIEAISGNAEIALTYLATALAHAPRLRDWARRDPDLVSLRQDARFKALVDVEDGEER